MMPQQSHGDALKRVSECPAIHSVIAASSSGSQPGALMKATAWRFVLDRPYTQEAVS